MAKIILVVDDSPTIRRMVPFSLKSAGYAVIEAADGQEGFDKANASSDTISLVLTDQNMPRIDGLTLIKTLRSLPKFVTTPILMLTTGSDDDMKAQGKAAGATGWRGKTVCPHK